MDEVNVQTIMEKLGGGGHRSVAGAQIKEGTIEDAKKRVKEALKEMTEKGEMQQGYVVHNHYGMVITF